MNNAWRCETRVTLSFVTRFTTENRFSFEPAHIYNIYMKMWLNLIACYWSYICFAMPYEMNVFAFKLGRITFFRGKKKLRKDILPNLHNSHRSLLRIKLINLMFIIQLMCLGGTNWWIILFRSTIAILYHHFDLDRGFGYRIHRVPKECWARRWKKNLPRWSVRSIELGSWPRKESRPPTSWNQACPSCYGGISWVRGPSCSHRKGST